MVGGNRFHLTRIVPGVMSAGGRTAGNPFDDGSGSGEAVVNGTRGGSQLIL